MPTFLVTVDGRYNLETEVEADNEDQAIALAHFDMDAQDILDGGTWGAFELGDDE